MMGAPKRSCKTCVWRLVNAGSNNGLHCGYSLCLTHHSRLWLHYQRTGRESLDGMTSDADCTEWMPGNPKDKLSLLQDDPAMVTDKAWALIARERGIEPAIVISIPNASVSRLAACLLIRFRSYAHFRPPMLICVA